MHKLDPLGESAKTFYFSLLLCALGWPLSLQAQEHTEPVAPSAEEQAAALEEEAHEALRGLRQVYEQAVNQNDLELIRPHLDEEFSGVMVTHETVTNFTSLQAYWQKIQELLGEGATYTTTLEPELSWIHGDIAVAKGMTQDMVVMPGGREFPFTSSFTAVLVKRGDSWKIRRIQGTMDPVTNAFIKAELRAASWISGGLAGGTALAIGLTLGFFWGRSRRDS